MGRAKAWLPWFGVPMIEHVVDRVAPAVDEVIVVRSAELELPPLRARIVTDREPGRGPLCGIRDGLAAAHAELAFVTSTDAPFVTSGYVRGLLARGRAVAPVAEGRVQVLSAVYPCTAWKQAAELLERGRARPLALLEALDFEPIEAAEAVARGRTVESGERLESVEPIEGAEGAERWPWRGFNTPAEYLGCAREVDPDATAELELIGRAARGLEERIHRVPIGTLAEVLACVPSRRPLLDGERVAKPFLVSLGGRELVRDARLPVGPGERLSVIDAMAGG
jgi:molybdopterin-guanine dinucleotide biosynthesis protein A